MTAHSFTIQSNRAYIHFYRAKMRRKLELSGPGQNKNPWQSQIHLKFQVDTKVICLDDMPESKCKRKRYFAMAI